MKYINEICPVCGRQFTENDDVVVCPICGTPHHRECYIENKTCINEARHTEEGFEWEPTSPTFLPFEHKAPVTPVNDGHNIILCPYCGSENPVEEPNCKNCGGRLYNNMQPGPAGMPVNLPNMQQEQFGNNVIQIQPNEIIGGNTVADTAEYVQRNAHKYIPKFYKMEKTGKKLSFNWAAFIFSPYWFFYRKMPVFGLVIMLLSLLVTGVCTTDRVVQANAAYNEAMQQYYAGQISQDAVIEASKQVIALPEMLISYAFNFAVALFGGFMGNALYKTKAQKDIAQAKQQAATPENYRMLLFKKGGVSILWVILALMGYTVASELISMIIQNLR